VSFAEGTMASVDGGLMAREEALKHENTGAVHMTSGFLFREEVTPNLRMEMDMESIDFNTMSEFQRVQVIRTASFGKTLVLDGKTQSAQADEFVYHECLVQPAMLAVGWGIGQPQHKAKRAYIGGGGELATARELLKHESIEEVVMVDLDKIVVDVSREKLPEWGNGCCDDPRLKLHFTDALGWLDRSDEVTGKFDIIVMDIADPVEAGPGIALYTQEFYQLAKRKLNPGGVLVTQSGPGGLLTHRECCCAVSKTLKTVFEHVSTYSCEVPSFGTCWSWNLAFDASGVEGSSLSAEEAKDAARAFCELSSSELESRLADRLSPAALRFYDGTSHRGIFGISKVFRKSLEDEDRIITKDNPVFMY